MAPDIIAFAHPFKAERSDFFVPEGLSVAQILRQAQPRPEMLQMAHVFIDGVPVPPEKWEEVCPREGQNVTVRVVPGGGGDGEKNPLATILSIVVIAAAAWVTGGAAAGLLGSSFGAGTFGAAALGAGIGIAGQLAVQAIAPPPTASMDALSGSNTKDSPTYNIQGGRNRMAPYGVVPRVYGRHLVVPPYGAAPYTELVGQTQYMRFLFVLGYGPVSVEEMKIGNTLIDKIGGVLTNVRQTGDEPFKLFPGIVHEDTTNLPALLKKDVWVQRTTQADADELSFDITFPSGLFYFDSDGKKKSRTVTFEAQYAPVGTGQWRDIAFDWIESRDVLLPLPPGTMRDMGYPDINYTFKRYDLVYIDKATGAPGVIQGARSVGGNAGDDTAYPPDLPADKYGVAQIWRYGHDPVGPEDITDIRDPALTAQDPAYFAPTVVSPYYVTEGPRIINIARGSFGAAELGVSAAKTSAVRYGQLIPVERGQYDVRVRRTSFESDSDQVSDAAYLTVLRSIRHEDPINMPGVATVELRMTASDALSGIIDQFNCVCTSILPDWNGTAWVNNPTSNPAAIYRDILTGPAARKKVDMARVDSLLQEFYDACATKGWEFNAVVDTPTTTFKLSNDVLSAGRASLAMRDGFYSVVYDRVQNNPAPLLTPRNSWDVRGEKVFVKPPHGIKVRFVNAAVGYQQDELIAYDDGYDEANATEFESLDLFGVTSQDQAWSHGRYYLACARLRPEIHSRCVDVEHLTFTRGDRIRVVDDVALHGLASARIRSVSTDGGGNVTAVVIDETVLMETGKTYALRIRLADGTSVYRALVTIAGEAETLQLATSIAAIEAPGPDDLVAFGETERETAEKIVTRIEMMSNLSARVFYVDYAPEVHSADANIPAFDPRITKPGDVSLLPPPVPEVLSVTSDESVILWRKDGTITYRIVISLLSGLGKGRMGFFEAKYRRAGEETPFIPLPRVDAFSGSGEVVISDVEEGEVYEIQVRSVSAYGIGSDWLQLLETVVGKSGEPPAPSTFLVRVQPDGTREFTATLNNPPIDFAGYKIRYRLGEMWSWDQMRDLHEGLIISFPWETNQLSAGTYTFACKCVDTGGVQSAEAKYITQALTDPRMAGVLASYSEYEHGWPGQKVGCVVEV